MRTIENFGENRDRAKPIPLFEISRSQLESDPSLVITKVDVKNAFNEIDPAAILAVVSANLPQVLPFADLLLAQSSMQTIFNDFPARRKHE